MSDFKLKITVEPDTSQLQGQIQKAIDSASKNTKLKLDFDVEQGFLSKQTSQIKKEMQSVSDSVSKTMNGLLGKNFDMTQPMSQINKISLAFKKLTGERLDVDKVINKADLKDLDKVVVGLKANLKDAVKNNMSDKLQGNISKIKSEIQKLKEDINLSPFDTGDLETKLQAKQQELAKLEESYRQLNKTARESNQELIDSSNDSLSKTASQVQSRIDANKKIVESEKAKKKEIAQINRQLQKEAETLSKKYEKSSSINPTTIQEQTQKILGQSGITKGFDVSNVTTQFRQLYQSVQNLSGVKLDNLNILTMGGAFTKMPEFQSYINNLSQSMFQQTQKMATNQAALENYAAALDRAKVSLEQMKQAKALIDKGMGDKLPAGLQGVTDEDIARQTNMVEQMTSTYERFKVEVSNANTQVGESVKRMADNATSNILNMKKEYEDAMQVMANPADLRKSMADIDSYIQANTKMSEANVNRLKTLQDQLKSGIQSGMTQKQLQNIRKEIAATKAEINASGETGKTFLDTFVDNLMKVSSYFSAASLIFMTINKIKESVRDVIELDNAMVELRKVAEATSSQFKNFYNNASEIGASLGTTTKEVIELAASWAQLG